MEDIMNLHDDWNVFEEVLTAASLPVEQGGIGIRLAFLEKDYWMTHALRNLASSRFAEQAVFKGGTSLSKACGVGYRFSEDIDIAITSDPDRSDNQTKTLVGGIGKAMSAGLEEVLMPDTRKFSKYRKAYYRYPQVSMGGEAGAVWTTLQPVFERELSELAYRPLPDSEDVVSSFKTIAGLLMIS